MTAATLAFRQITRTSASRPFTAAARRTPAAFRRIPVTATTFARTVHTAPALPSRARTASSIRTMATTAASKRNPTPPLVPFRTHSPQPNASKDTPLTHVFFHQPTSTWTYLVVCPTTRKAAVIDSVLDFDPVTNTVSTETADGLLAFAEQEHIHIERILETHAHADHLTGAAYLQLRLGGNPAAFDSEIEPLAASATARIPIGAYSAVRETQAHFARLYEVPMEELENAFDELYEEGSKLRIGDCEGEVWHLPGHTECSAGYVFGDAVYTGDSVLLVSTPPLFSGRLPSRSGQEADSFAVLTRAQPSIGSARVDFPAGSATRLFASSQRLLSLPSHFRLFSGHHYAASPTYEGGNRCSATVGEQKALNKHFKEGTAPEEFVKMREERDKELNEPRLLHQSLQVSRRFLFPQTRLYFSFLCPRLD
jgi:glyoxylase-like metal-dependent hydrolase (beta-lactamase superfamily II)